ncbi:hypothetical protein RDI58_017368 [Solanum bulbocastanum]|uniref:Uncharacterized protein n=1 Tax=Solanum bulbocastanum TaxID=147425 RepID=A0AAN8T9R2_SOLBU
MFLASIGSKKKLKTKNYSKVSSKRSVDESEKSVNKDWWKIMYVVIKENKYSRSIKKSMSAKTPAKTGWLKATAQRGNKEDASFSLAEQIEEYNT